MSQIEAWLVIYNQDTFNDIKTHPNKNPHKIETKIHNQNGHKGRNLIKAICLTNGDERIKCTWRIHSECKLRQKRKNEKQCSYLQPFRAKKSTASALWAEEYLSNLDQRVTSFALEIPSNIEDTIFTNKLYHCY